MGASGKLQRARSGYSIPRTIPPQVRHSRIRLHRSSAIEGGYCHSAGPGARFGFRRRFWHSIWVWLCDFIVDASTSLRMSRSWKDCRHLAQDVSILERVSSPRSACLDLGKGVSYGPQLHKRRLYELRGYEHICKYEYICELHRYE